MQHSTRKLWGFLASSIVYRELYVFGPESSVLPHAKFKLGWFWSKNGDSASKNWNVQALRKGQPDNRSCEKLEWHALADDKTTHFNFH